MTNKEFFSSNWQKETKRTLVAVKALPTEMNTLDYKHDAKARNAHQIIGHILPHSESLLGCIDNSIINEKDRTFSSTGEAYNYLETQSALLLEKLKTVDDNTWENSIVSLEVNGRKLYEGKMMDMYWTLMFDTIHHRGQLSTYYRSMGVRNPSIYGPSAEDIEDRIAAAQAASN